MLGFENDLGDYECRDKYFKGIFKVLNFENISVVKDIIYIFGRDKFSFVIFEGFMDFFLVFIRKGEVVFVFDVVILNMINMRRRVIDFIKQFFYQWIYIFFDNDSVGQKIIEIFKEEFGGRLRLQNYLYIGYKDYNVFYYGGLKQ